MKARSLLSFMVSLSALVTGLSTRPQSATAAPAPIFRPIIRDIQNQLPRNLVFRLPSNLPTSLHRSNRLAGVEPEFRADRESFSLTIKYVGCERDFQPGGRGYAINCVPLSIYSSTLSSQGYQEFNQRFRQYATSVNLQRNVQAYHSTLGDGWYTIQWVQDRTFFMISSPSWI
ncbi:hypothetical protein MiSe_11610 [Microseira wollei NIES-4236]|uniref:Uncharacterized protein n=2 Tax=Microseira wollei TaxID=467598 RepID=A0AAV3X3P6_9CYAN|nr:hypothetical protein MiSe_11610 [Microseira wollei NIES-4236]